MAANSNIYIYIYTFDIVGLTPMGTLEKVRKRAGLRDRERERGREGGRGRGEERAILF